MSIYLKDIAAALEHLVEKQEEYVYPRHYLGASQVGHPCARYLWFYFRWAALLHEKAHTKRIFDTGDNTEKQVLEALNNAGFDIQHNQYEFKAAGGHVCGHIDGLTESLPELKDVRVLVEIKSMQDKYFKSFVKQGIAQSHPAYFKQALVYAYRTEAKLILFAIKNKNDDKIKYEFKLVNHEKAKDLLLRLSDVVFSPVLPRPVSESPDYYQCKWCAFSSQCHEQANLLKSCRTCSFSRPTTLGEWFCSFHEENRTIAQQKAACENFSSLNV